MEEPSKSSTTSSITIENLPREILWIIFSYMDQKTAQSSTSTCKLWFELIRGNSDLSSHIYLEPIELHELDERLWDLQLIWARWPVLKTIHFLGYYPIYATEKIAKYSLRLVDSTNCPTLKRVTISASYCLTRFSLELIGNTTFRGATSPASAPGQGKTTITWRRAAAGPAAFYFANQGKTAVLSHVAPLTFKPKDIYIKFVNPIKDMNIHYFQTYFCQLLFWLTNSLQRVQIQVLELYYIEALFPNLRDITDLYVMNTTYNDFLYYDLGKMGHQFKNLRKFHINVNCHMKSKFEDYYEFPADIRDFWQARIDKKFQDITDVKIQIYRGAHYTGEMFFTIIKKPNQKTEIVLVSEALRK